MGTIVTEAKGENLTNVREEAERERRRRRKRYKFALVKWDKEIGGWEDQPTYSVEHKEYVLAQWWQRSYEVICDDQPYKVLKGMLKLMKEDGCAE